MAADRNRYANDYDTLAASMSLIVVVISHTSVFYSINGLSSYRVQPSRSGAAALPRFFNIILLIC